MKTEDILDIEDSGGNRINLVRDRLFWQAWNRSAFLFATHIKSYHVHKRLVKKVSQEVAWLGFPSSALPAIEKIAAEKGFSFERKSADHIAICNVAQTSGYEKWWAGVVKAKPPPADSSVIAALSRDPEHRLLPAYKIVYDLCLHIHRATAKMSKEFRYELGSRVRGYITELAENLHLMANDIKAGSAEGRAAECAGIAHKLRLDLRILKDLCQISVKQWGFLNRQLDSFLNLLRAECLQRLQPQHELRQRERKPEKQQ